MGLEINLDKGDWTTILQYAEKGLAESRGITETPLQRQHVKLLDKLHGLIDASDSTDMVRGVHRPLYVIRDPKSSRSFIKYDPNEQYMTKDGSGYFGRIRQDSMHGKLVNFVKNGSGIGARTVSKAKAHRTFNAAVPNIRYVGNDTFEKRLELCQGELTICSIWVPDFRIRDWSMRLGVFRPDGSFCAELFEAIDNAIDKFERNERMSDIVVHPVIDENDIHSYRDLWGGYSSTADYSLLRQHIVKSNGQWKIK